LVEFEPYTKHLSMHVPFTDNLKKRISNHHFCHQSRY